jgi:acetylornithine/N-succinyldiaminopimelate aminotransferase
MTLFDVYPLFDIEIQRGEGCYVFDTAGRRYLDFYGGHAVISIGHSHPHYVQRITEQLKQIGFYSNSVQIPLQQELAEKLGRLSGCEEYQLFLVNSGAEAIENALKLASFHTGKTKILAFEKAFHGRTAAAVNVTHNDSIVAPLNRGFGREFLPWNDLESVERHLSNGDVCAVIIEGIQGIGGIHVPDAVFLRMVSQFCKKHGAVLILDEIQSGYGRSGKFFAHQHAGIETDLITVAKGMGNGFPIGGVLIHPKFKAKHGLLGTTFGGNHLACAAALAVLEVIENEKLIENAARQGERLISALSSLDGIREVRGEGLMIGVEFGFPAGPLRQRMLDEFGVFTGSASNKNVMRLLPPLTVGDAEVEMFLGAFEECLSTFVAPHI